MQFEKLIKSFENGEIYSLAKMISLVENNPENAWKIIEKLKIKSDPHIIGVTGSPGAGKSTIVSKIVSVLSEKEKIGIIAVDPSSPFTGGAFLGDRIRMRSLYKNENVYIRSVASRGSVGGLCDAIFDIVDVMKAFGFDRIIIETVGAGQSEIEIVFVADTVILAMSPDSGDEIQMFKAGIMEIADAYIVNKTDLPESNAFLINLKNTLMLGDSEACEKKIFPVSAVLNEGIKDVCDYLKVHYENLVSTGEISLRKTRRKRRRIRSNIMRTIDNITEYYNFEKENLTVSKENIIKKFIEEVSDENNRN